MNGATKAIIAILVAESLLVLAALTSQSWMPGGEQEDLGLGVLVVTSFIGLFIIITSALAVATVASGALWLRALRPRTNPDSVVLALGLAVTAASAGYVSFFFGFFK